ncbi:MgtC/SapB family protein [uncultured Desulfuromonas sp.]|uniref:MgtC/SapB family protein n=1 Tax=uncultured Desulfuromonas sp. TaxID=181013 RepID=UPI002AAB0F9F|nr:MgtC/SapB family protein [uncultured Desulfuromonas sp.]
MWADNPMVNSQFLLILKLVLAFIAGTMVGIEREKHGRPAGLRTHILVCVGACLMMVVSEGVFFKFGHLSAESVVRLDPGRIGAQIITGIGFLGAGVILKEGVSVRGLTTAACLWYVAGLGMAFGMGMFLIGAVATALALIALIAMKKLEPVLKKDRFLNLCVVTGSEVDVLDQLQQVFTNHQVFVFNIEQDINLMEKQRRYDFVLTRHQQRIGRDLVGEILELNGVIRVRYK